MKYILSLVCCIALQNICSAQVITTVAGDGSWGYGGDGGPAVNAALYGAGAAATDSSGNLYIADMINDRVRKVSPDGIITTYAGTGYNSDSISGGYSGDGGPADSADLYWPSSIAIDATGNIYIADAGNNRIRMVNTAGIISTCAGTGVRGYSGDGGPALSARLNYPAGIFLDRNHNLYIADVFNNRIRMVDTSGIISTIAGNGYTDSSSAFAGGYGGDGGPADSAEMYWPSAVATDKNGNVYIADMMNNCIRKVSPAGIISTISGNDTVAGYNGDSILATSARLCAPSAVTLDTGGNIYIGDGGNNRIRVITPDGFINTFAGTGYGGFSGDGGLCTEADLFSPDGMAIDRYGNMYVADEANYRIREISAVPDLVKNIYPASEITAFPDPATDYLEISFPPAPGTSEIILCDLYGKAVLHEDAAPYNTKVAFHVSNIPRGTYLVKVKTGGYYACKKVIVD